jgi:hypothetical protein
MRYTREGVGLWIVEWQLAMEKEARVGGRGCGFLMLYNPCPFYSFIL